VALTPAGTVFLDGARSTLRAAARTVSSVRSLAAPGTLRVGLHVAAGGERPTALLAEFGRAHPTVEIGLRTFDLAHPAAGLLDGATDVAFVRPPVDAPNLVLRTVATEPRVVVLAAAHPLAGAAALSLDEIGAEPWIAAVAAVDGCSPFRWRDDWLLRPRPDGREPLIGAIAATIDEWREHVAAGRGVSLCPASAERFYARPGLVFVPAIRVPPAELCVASRADDPNPLVRQFVALATGDDTKSVD
jgi:DNA-binding transcriptional LysR family regulator